VAQVKAPLLALALAASLTGCMGLFGGETPTAGVDEQQQIADEVLGKAGRDKLVDAAAIIPKNYSFPAQRLLPPVTVQVKGAVASDANGGYEAERDEGGIDYNNKVLWQDVTSLLPPGQPAELVVKLTWDASEANSADLDIALDVPGTRTTYRSLLASVRSRSRRRPRALDRARKQFRPRSCPSARARSRSSEW
jgi:hypothetical protein